jgi:ABC-type transport system involved in multi-copper enzyme maturation permease subunit
VMSVLSSMFLWAQAAPVRIPAWKWWLLIFGEPGDTIPGLLGGLITWVKALGLFCLVAWVSSWVITALKERKAARTRPLDVAALVALIGGLLSVLLAVSQAQEKARPLVLAGQPVASLLGIACMAVLLAWVETTLWAGILRLGKRADLAVLAALHLALGLGLAGALATRDIPDLRTIHPLATGVRLGATFMGYVVLLRVTGLLALEVVALRARRLYAIAWHTVLESNRRMWAPWLVLTVFAVFLAFTHWFLQPPEDQRAAELGRLYVGTLMLLGSMLLTAMVVILTPISMPHDIQQQTIATVVTKPVRRLELIWGRILGFMALVTVLLLVFGGASLLYLNRTVGGTIREIEAAAGQARQQGRTAKALELQEQADQMRTRMSARFPVQGSLSFIDSRGKLSIKGIDVGTEMVYRSHIEGATQAKAIWRYGLVQDPMDIVFPDPYGRLRPVLDRRIPLDLLLVPGTYEELANRAFDLKVRARALGVQRAEAPQPSARETARLSTERKQLLEEAVRVEAEAARAKAANRHSPPLPLEMTFNVYRTTKGKLGEPVYASIKATNPTNPSATEAEHTDIFPIREYYTNKLTLPSGLLVGSQGALVIEIQCISPTQYLGMAEGDLFILTRQGSFYANYMKGLFGIWLQALVLTAIGVFAGTFLSWPVALLTAFAFFLAGQVAFSVLRDIATNSLIGGGPFESLIRLLSHENQMSDLAPTLAVVTAKGFDALVMPILSRLIYIVPNFSALDVSNTVADGFAVSGWMLLVNLLVSLGYALPFSVAGYFILKHRELAA